ncbi:MAG TPA: ABC transporter permease [Tepidisphaeraceae bacterium]|nr:ABC transporter permease [Tepidisphaeraceae bacterium]
MPARSTILATLRHALIWLVILGLWEGAYRVIGWRPWIFPAPSHVIDSMLGMLNVHTAFGDEFHSGWPKPLEAGHVPGGLVVACMVSAIRLAIGFALSIALGGLLGMAMWRFQALDDFLGPFLLGLQTLPSVCWVPLGIVTFGLNERGVMFVLVMGSFSAIAIALRDGLRTMPPLYRRAGLMLGATGWKLYRHVLLPASLPAFATSLRQGFSFAWRSLLGAELIFSVVNHGLGFLLQNAREIGGPSDVIAVMIVMIMIGMLADRWFFAKLQRSINTRFGLG